ncbi:hypothetical protein ACM66B_004489 [Microbotryomycetes sp. NB124-2]
MEAHAVSAGARSTTSGTRNLAPYRPSSETLSFAPRTKTQPLYRPAALRRSSPAPHRAAAPTPTPSAAQHHQQQQQHQQQQGLSPLPSPALSSPDISSKHTAGSSTSWLPWSSANDGSANALLSSTTPLGTMVPRAQWRPDEEALICSDATCTERFSLLVRKHHCRRCGEVFCSSHSSRNAALWPNMEDYGSLPVTPGATPRPSPRSSHIDIPSLVAGHTSPGSSAISVASSSGSNSSHVSPVVQTRALVPVLGHPQLVRVCDACFFSAPTPPLQTPPLSAAGIASFAFASRPVTLRHPRSGQSTPSLSTSPSFSQSPPRQRRSQRSREPSVAASSRSRQNSANSVVDSSSIGASSVSTAATSLEQQSSTSSAVVSTTSVAHRRSYSSVAARAVSPSSSLRYNAIVCVPTTSTGPLRNSFEATTEEQDGEEEAYDRDELDSDEEQALADEEARQRKLRRLRRAGVRAGDDEDEEDDDDDEDYDEFDQGPIRDDEQIEVLNDLVNARGPLVKTKFGSVQQGWTNWATF